MIEPKPLVRATSSMGCPRLLAYAALLLPPLIVSCGDGDTTAPAPAPAPVTGSIAGTVSVEGRGLDGVTISLAGGATTTTSAAGTYRFDNVAGGNHAVAIISGIPSDVIFASTTATATITSAGQTARVDFEGTYVRTSTVAGLVSVADIGLGDVTVEISGPDERSTETDIAGAFAFRTVRAGTYVVRISGFDPEAVGFDRTEQEVSVRAGETAMADFDGLDLAEEEQVLLVLYEATGGASWGAALGWSPDRPVAEWGGVETDSAGAVTGLNLRDAGLAGEMPPALGNLTRLQHVDFASNRLHGEIPASIFGDTSLVSSRAGDADGEVGASRSIVSFDVSNNELSGPIPRTVGEAVHLQEFILGNSLVGDTSRMVTSEVDGNRLPIGVSATNPNPAREKHRSEGNRLTGPIPRDLGNLTDIEVLDLGGNQLTGPVPPELGNLAEIEQLILHDNQLTGEIPAGYTRLERLRRFSWGGNAGLCAPTTDEFQTWLAGLTHRSGPDCAIDRDALVALYEATDGPNWENSENWLTDAPLGEWYGVTTDSDGRVVGLSLRGRHVPEREVFIPHGLNGAIPSEVGDLSALRELNLERNALSGPIPPELGNLANLEVVNLGGNNLSGGIPAELGSLVNLVTLALGANQLTGSIPPELGSLSNLRELSVQFNNGLSGALPNSLINLGNLRRFWFYETRLCAPNDDAFVAWMEAVEARSTHPSDTVLGPYCDRRTSEILLRDDFATRASLENWTLGNNTSAGVENGLLELANTEEGSTALAYHVDDGVSATNWRVTARMARERDDVRMIIWLIMDHDVYQDYRFEIGSGFDVDGRNTNYRFFAWNDNRDGRGEGGWVYFSDFGYGFSDAVNDGTVDFNEVDYSIIDGALSMNVNGTTVAGLGVVPAFLPTDIVGIGLASASSENRAYATTRFDWVELNGQLLGATASGEMDGARVPPEVADRLRRLDARLLAVGDVKEGTDTVRQSLSPRRR